MEKSKQKNLADFVSTQHRIAEILIGMTAI